MNFRTKFVQDLCATSTETYEELLQLAFNEATFLQNVQNLQKPALEAFVRALLMKQRGKLPDTLLNGDGFKLPSIVSLVHDNYLRLQEDGDTFRWIKSALTLAALLENDRQVVRVQLETFVDRFEQDLHEIELYYEVLHAFLIIAEEDPELIPSCSRLNGERMVCRLTSMEWSMTARMKVLTCLQPLMQFKVELYEQWLSLAQNPQQPIGGKVFLLRQLLETALCCADDRKADILRTLQLDHVWLTVIEGFTDRDAVCRNDAFTFLRHAMDYAKQACEVDLIGTYFGWKIAESGNQAWETFVQVVEGLSVSENKLTLPVYVLIWIKFAILHDAWKHVLLRLILGHENRQVVNDGINYFIQDRKFNASEKELEKAFLATFNAPAGPLEPFSVTIAKLRDYYKTREAYAFLLDTIPEIVWESVPYYCVASAVYKCTRLLADEYKRLQQTKAAIESLTNCIKVSHAIKNASLRYVAFVSLVKSIVQLSEPTTEIETLLAVNVEVEKFAKTFAITLEDFRVEDGSTLFSHVNFRHRALEPYFGRINPADTFFIEQVLVEKMKDPFGYYLSDQVVQSNIPVYFRILLLVPDLETSYGLDSLLAADLSSKQTRIEQAVTAGDKIPPDAFTMRKEMIDMMQAVLKFKQRWSMGHELNRLLSYLGRLALTRLDSFDYANPTSAIETIRLAHLVTWHDKSVAQRFFRSITLKDLMDNLERHRTEEPLSIDQVYVMIAEIYLNYRQHLGDWLEMYVKEEEWTELLLLLDIDNINVLTTVVEILHADAKKVDPQECHDCEEKRFLYDRCLEKIMNYRQSDQFMGLMARFIEMLFLPYILCPPHDVGDDVWIPLTVNHYVFQFLEQYSTIHGLANIVYHCIAQLPVEFFNGWTMDFGKNFLLRGMMYGDVPSRDPKLELDAIKNCGTHIPFKQHYEKELCQVRVLCVLHLYRLYYKNEPEQNKLLLRLKDDLLKRFMLKSYDESYFDRIMKTVTPREKFWILQALCIAMNLTATQPDDSLLQLMLYETNPPTIQHLLELIIADSCIVTQTIAKSLHSERITLSGVQSVCIILWWRCCLDNTLANEYIRLMESWTMSNDFFTSLWAQITIMKLLEQFKRTDSVEFKILYALFKKSYRQKHMKPQLDRLKQDIRFKFDCQQLVTLENVFHNIPMAAGAPVEDIVTTGMLKECIQIHGGRGEEVLGKAFKYPKLAMQMGETFPMEHEIRPMGGLKVGGGNGRRGSRRGRGSRK